MPAPKITIQSISKSKISDEVTMDQSVVIFRTDRQIRAWEARAGGMYNGSGLILGESNHLFPSAATLPSASTYPSDFKQDANTDIQFEIDNEELQQDGEYQINIYACSDDDGTWTPYEDT